MGKNPQFDVLTSKVIDDYVHLSGPKKLV
jgi:hypothetical protein